MKNIRSKVFETNSSSTHSISIYPATSGMYDTIVPDDHGAIVLVGGTFGWEWEKYADAFTKANYAAIFAHGDTALESMLKSVIKDHTGAKEVIFNFNTEDYDGENYSYIDHQSGRAEGGDAGQAFSTPQTLKDWIFHPESWLFTGNDNDESPPNFYDVELDFIYTHELSVEGVNLIAKFQEYPSENKMIEALNKLMRNHPICDYSNSTDFEFVYYDHHTPDGNKFNSLDKIKENIIIVFDIKVVHSPQGAFIGYEIKDSKEIKFSIKEI